MQRERFRFVGKLRKEDDVYATAAWYNILLTKINSFGFIHSQLLTKKGTPSDFIRWGYIRVNSGAYYRVAVLTVRELQDKLGNRCQIDRKEEVELFNSSRKVTAINWHMSIKSIGTETDNTENK